MLHLNGFWPSWSDIIWRFKLFFREQLKSKISQFCPTTPKYYVRFLKITVILTSPYHLTIFFLLYIHKVPNKRVDQEICCMFIWYILENFSQVIWIFLFAYNQKWLFLLFMLVRKRLSDKIWKKYIYFFFCQPAF